MDSQHSSSKENNQLFGLTDVENKVAVLVNFFFSNPYSFDFLRVEYSTSTDWG